MHCTVSVRTAFDRQTMEDRLRALLLGGPFRVRDLVPVGGDGWTFHLQPERPGIVVGFGKVAEFLVLLAREFDVQAVERRSSRCVAATS